MKCVAVVFIYICNSSVGGILVYIGSPQHTSSVLESSVVFVSVTNSFYREFVEHVMA